jgi:hypothetical protein
MISVAKHVSQQFISLLDSEIAAAEAEEAEWWKERGPGKRVYRCANARVFNFSLESCLEEKTIYCRNVQEFGSIFMLLVNTEDLDPGK